ncbi:MAG: terminase family protein [Cyanobacteria bacterium P01_A01_bin.84]
MNIENRIAALERKFKSNLSKETIKSIPTDWEQFVGLTTIRSGGAMKPFIPYEYQKIISNLMDKYNNIIAVKSRQTGITQMVVSKFLHRAALNAAYSAMAFMRNSEDASAISRRARQMLSGLDAYIKPDNDNVGYLKLRDKGDIYFRNSGKEGCRSYDSVLDFLFDEAAFCPNIQEIYAASSPSGALAGDLITKMIVSTPSAKSGWYWEKLSENNGGLDIEEICKDVADGKLYKDIPGLYYFEDKAGTLKLVIHYSCHPVYNQRKDYLEYRMLQDGTDYETVEREYNLKFIDASVAVFSSDLVRMKCYRTL